MAHPPIDPHCPSRTETLQAGSAGRCEIETGGALPVETVRRLACEASLVSMIETE